jgi:hypothetical protein
MVRLAVLPTAFEARLLAARLGCEGVLWELRGNVGGPYPVGPVEVLVRPDDFALACELLLVDEIEDVFEDDDLDGGGDDDGYRPRRSAWHRWARIGVPLVLVGSLLGSASLLVHLVEQAG